MKPPHPKIGATPPLDPEIGKIYRILADRFADQYVESFLIPQLGKASRKDWKTLQQWCDELEDPLSSLRVLLGYYAFSRRGKDREELSRIALRSLDQVLENRTIDELLVQPNGLELWTCFVAECANRGKKPNENQNRGLVQGLLELAQEIYRIDEIGSVAGWVAEGVQQTGRLEPQFLRIVDIRGVGPKNTSTFLRDMVFLYDLETSVMAADRIYMQPVDRWLRAICRFAVPEPDLEEAPDWIVAGKINKYARRAGVSLVRFDLGLTYFGQRIVRSPDRLEQELKLL